MKTSDRALVTAAVAAFTLAFALRLWNVAGELPFHYHPEESVALDAAITAIASGDPDPGWVDRPAGLLWLALGPVAVLHAVADAPLERPQGPSVSPGMLLDSQLGFLLGARALVALLGALTALIVAVAARRFAEDALSPLLAGFALAVMPAHVALSQRLSPEVPAAFGVALALLGALSIARRGPSWLGLLLAGAAAGLAAAFDYRAALVIVSPCVVLLADGRWSRARRAAGVAALLLVAVATFAVLSPWSLLVSGRAWAVVLEGAGPSGSLGALSRLTAPEVLGPAVLGLAALSLLTILVPGLRGREGRALLAIFPSLLAWLALLAWRGPHEAAAFAALLAPGLALLLGVAASALARLLRPRALALVGQAVLLVALAPVALGAGATVWANGLPRTETRAYDWFIATVPPGAVVVRDWDGPQLAPSRFQVRAALSVADLGTMGLEELGADFVVVTTPSLESVRSGRAPGRRPFLEALFAARPAAVFCPEPGRVRGPEVWVFPWSERARRLVPRPTREGRCALDDLR